MITPFHAAPVPSFNSEDDFQNNFLADMQDDYLNHLLEEESNLPEIETPGILDREIQILDDWELQDSYNYYNSCKYNMDFAAIDF